MRRPPRSTLFPYTTLSRSGVQAEAHLGDAVTFDAKVDAAAKAACRTSLTLNSPAEPLTASPPSRNDREKFLGIAELVPLGGSRDRGPANHPRISALLHDRCEVVSARGPERDARLCVDQNRHSVGEAARGRQCRRAHIWYVVGG